MHEVQLSHSGDGLMSGSLDDGKITFDTSARERGDMRDPVCGKSLAPGTGFATIYEGTEYRFCSEACRDEFAHEPKRYAG